MTKSLFNQHSVLSNFLLSVAAISGFIQLPSPLPADDPKSSPIVLQCRGYVVPSRQVMVAPKVAGEVVEMLVEEGRRVKAGEMLAKLDATEFRIALELARAELRLAEAGIAKAREGTSKADLEVALAKVAIAKARVELAQFRLDGTVVRAPIDGVVLTKRADVGTRFDPRAAQAPASLCELADPRTLELEIWIAERDLSRVAKGQSCVVQTEAFPKNSYRGRVERVLPVADRAKGTIGVRIRLEIPENDTVLRPEMSALVTITAAS